MKKSWFSLNWLVLALAILAGCREVPKADSDLKIDSGITIDGNSSNKSDAVFMLASSLPGANTAAYCTGTAVSDRTIVFAAHCVADLGADPTGTVGNYTHVKGQTCATNGTKQNVCTQNVFMATSFTVPADIKFAFDVAIAVYPAGTFQTYAEVAADPVKLQDQVLLVGYSQVGLDPGAQSSKRWGHNQVSQFLSNITIVTDYGGSQNAVGVSPGDSGGPMFRDCKVIGVASRMSGVGAGGAKSSLHTNLTWPNNNKWLQEAGAVNAKICGLSPDSCDQNGKFVAYTPSNPDEFPCHSGTASSGTGTNNLNPNGLSANDVFVALNADTTDTAFSLSVSQKTADNGLVACLVGSGAVRECDSLQTAFNAPVLKDGLYIYAAKDKLAIANPAATTQWLLVKSGTKAVSYKLTKK